MFLPGPAIHRTSTQIPPPIGSPRGGSCLAGVWLAELWATERAGEEEQAREKRGKEHRAMTRSWKLWQMNDIAKANERQAQREAEKARRRAGERAALLDRLRYNKQLPCNHLPLLALQDPDLDPSQARRDARLEFIVEPEQVALRLQSLADAFISGTPK